MTAVCYHCGDRPAACYGAYEGSQVPATACDICCGHGNEDGWCIQIADMLEREELVREVIRASRHLHDVANGTGHYLAFEAAERDLQAAARALREWKP